MESTGFADLNFVAYFEPEEGISDARDFTQALLDWAKKEGKDITILEEGMEPVAEIDGKTYVCRLAEPGLATQNNAVVRKLLGRGWTHKVGAQLGYKWVYLYRK